MVIFFISQPPTITCSTDLNTTLTGKGHIMSRRIPTIPLTEKQNLVANQIMWLDTLTK